MEELNEIRVRARNRILICCGVVLIAGLAAAIAVGHPIVLFLFLPIAFIASLLTVDKPRKEYRAAFKEAVVRQALESVFTDLIYEPKEGISYENFPEEMRLFNEVARTLDPKMAADETSMVFKKLNLTKLVYQNQS